MQATPEIGKSIRAGGALTNYHEAGQGTPVILIHGSGPGVSAWANWSRTIPSLAEHFHVFAYDQLGFGYTELPRENRYGLEQWTEHLLDFMRAVGVAQAHLIGNSMGAAIALAVAVKHPEVVDRLVLMGAAGVRFPLTDGLPAPRQQGVDDLAAYENRLGEIHAPALVIHGRDDRVIPLSTSEKLLHKLENVQLHVFGHCGHWTQIEHAAAFNRLVQDFLME